MRRYSINCSLSLLPLTSYDHLLLVLDGGDGRPEDHGLRFPVAETIVDESNHDHYHRKSRHRYLRQGMRCTFGILVVLFETVRLDEGFYDLLVNDLEVRRPEQRLCLGI